MYQTKGSYAASSHSHDATDINQDSTHRFVTDSEKANWDSKAAGNHNHDSVYQPKGSYAASSHKHTATDVEEDSTHRFMTDAERTKLSGIASGANNYSHPASHPASMIEESTTRKFMTDAEKTLLSSLGTNAIQLESQNLWNEKAQNGYVKLSNGLLIQWGKQLGSTATTVTIYMPLSFCNTDYIIQGCIIKDAYDGNVYTATPLINPTISSFKMDRNFGSSSGTGVSRAKYSWIAIGRWK